MRQQGKGRGRGRGRRRRMMGFLQPCILVQLYRLDRHGYELLKGLEAFIDNAEEYDPSVLYRLMRDMEENNYVRSYEGTESRGPKRKMYSITTEGKKILEHWVEDLQRTGKEIDNLVDIYKENKALPD